MPTVGPEPFCPACSKPVASGVLGYSEHGELFHVRCRGEALGLRSLGTAPSGAGSRLPKPTDSALEEARRARDPERFPPTGLEAEIRADEARRAELEAHHHGKFAVFHGEALMGIYDSLQAAADEAKQAFGAGPYLIRQIGVPPVIP